MPGAEISGFLNSPSGLYSLGSKTQSRPLAFQDSPSLPPPHFRPHSALQFEDEGLREKHSWMDYQTDPPDTGPGAAKGLGGPESQSLYIKWLLSTVVVGEWKSSVKSRHVFSQPSSMAMSVHHFGPD